MKLQPFPASLRRTIKQADVKARAKRDYSDRPKSEAEQHAVHDIKMEKMLVLYQHYGIDPESDGSAGFKLAKRLAEDHVPGMSLNRSGRPRDTLRVVDGIKGKKSLERGARYAAISGEMKRTSSSLAGAVRKAATSKAPEWVAINPKTPGLETSRKAYSRVSAAGGIGDFLAPVKSSNRQRKK